MPISNRYTQDTPLCILSLCGFHSNPVPITLPPLHPVYTPPRLSFTLPLPPSSLHLPSCFTVPLFIYIFIYLHFHSSFLPPVIPFFTLPVIPLWSNFPFSLTLLSFLSQHSLSVFILPPYNFFFYTSFHFLQEHSVILLWSNCPSFHPSFFSYSPPLCSFFLHFL